ncbi:phage integrase family protein [Pacificibacter maritimus]|uniref:Phage integrase family protein n=1 Tax=Pacificibacter maritimus TaxID=762213 RepID=A0A3N4UEV5_9RHOB|nr:tyrosine-type recombinase/integrase [Pacificibacter maritimus]RPE66985.1 phage integrase family protein [Pacificibacter maritimus]
MDINGEKRSKRTAVAEASDAPTLFELLGEYAAVFGATKKIWAPAGPRTKRTQAGRVIERVFKALLDRPVSSISVEEFAKCVNGYEAVKRLGAKNTANGQASKARLYLSPVLDWAAGRNTYSKLGSSRLPLLKVVGLENIHDPASNDPQISGKRDRVLKQEELQAILPFLKYPAPQIGKLRVDAKADFRPIAMRFMLFTAARREEVVEMRWRDLDRTNNVWRKPHVKSTKGGARSQDLPLSQSAVDILKVLPGWTSMQPNELVFPNSNGTGKLGNWQRFQNALYEATGTEGWHRHDLRRTAATLMRSIKVPASVIEQVLAHTDPFKSEGLGGAATNYIKLTRIMNNTRDPQEEALSRLAEALIYIETL